MSSSQKQPDPPAATRPWRMIVAVVWLLGFSVFFYTRPFSQQPNGNRLQLLAESPRLVVFELLDVIDPPAENPEKLPAGWQFLPERLGLWLVALFVWAGAWAAGRLVLRAGPVSAEWSRSERFVFACGVGAAVVSLLTLAAGLAGWLERGVLGGVLLTALFAEGLCRFRSASQSPPVASDRQLPAGFGWLIAAAVPFLVVMLFGSLLPPLDFDVKEYHLQGPKEWFLAGQITFLPHNVYTSFPFLTEMLSLLGMVLWDDWFRGALVGQAVLMGFAPLTALACFAAGRRWFGPWAGGIAALIYLTTPWTTMLATTAYVEGGLSFYLVAATLATSLVLRSADFRMTVLAGFLAGSAMACKYPGLVSVVLPLGVALLVAAARQSRRRALGTGLAFALGVGVAVGPWVVKNLMQTGNPVYPLAWSVFGGRDWNADLDAKWTAAHSPGNHDPRELILRDGGRPGWLPQVLVGSEWLSGLLFALAPLAFFRKDHRAWPLGLYIAWLFVSWWALTHRIDRFWVPMLPVVALLAGAGAMWTTHVGWRWLFVAAGVVGWTFNWALAFAAAAPLSLWADLDAARVWAAHQTAPALQQINEWIASGRLPSDVPVKILSVGDAEVFDARFPVVYETVFDESIFQQWTAEPQPDLSADKWPLRPPEELRRTFREHGITHVLVDWAEIRRYRQTYGYTDFVQPGRFTALEAVGVLGPPIPLGTDEQLYPVR